MTNKTSSTELSLSFQSKFSFSQDQKSSRITTSKLKVTLDMKLGNFSFLNPDGTPLIRELDRIPRTYAPETLNGEETYHIVARFAPNETEAFYGLGQHQN